MVRLKDYKTNGVYIQSVKFQFLNGSIKRRQDRYNQEQKQHFNSSMVRLKDDKTLDFIILSEHFNSSMVRLKE